MTRMEESRGLGVRRVLASPLAAVVSAFGILPANRVCRYPFEVPVPFGRLEAAADPLVRGELTMDPRPAAPLSRGPSLRERLEESERLFTLSEFIESLIRQGYEEDPRIRPGDIFETFARKDAGRLVPIALEIARDGPIVIDFDYANDTNVAELAARGADLPHALEDCERWLAGGRLSASRDEFSRGPLRTPALGEGDRVGPYDTGGAGYADPLERDPQRVLADVEAGILSAEVPGESREFWQIERWPFGPAPEGGADDR